MKTQKLAFLPGRKTTPLLMAFASSLILLGCSSELKEGLAPEGNSVTDSAVAVTSSNPGSLIAGLTISPKSATLAPGTSVTFTPQGWNAGANTPVATPVRWTATGGTINSAGVYTAGSTPGTYQVKAASTTTNKTEIAAITITGTAVTVSSIDLTPATVSVGSGATQQFAVTARMSNGSNQANPAVTYSATGGTISSTGLFTAGSTAGSFRVIARTSNGRADSSTVTVTTGSTVRAIVTAPSASSVTTGATRQFTASATMSNGSTQSNPAVTWTATGGTVNNSGLYTAGNTAGTFRVIARQSSGSMADTSTVTVTSAAATVVGIDITPGTISLLGGLTQQFSAVARMSNNTTQPISVTWRVSGGSISVGGLFTAPLLATSVNVIATQQGGTLADTARVTITLLPPTNPGGGASPEPSGSSSILHQGNMENTSGYSTRGSVSTVGGRTGNALRFSYSSGSPDNLIEKSFSGSTDVYVRYWYRINASGSISSIGGASGMKWFMLWRASGPRYTNGVGNLGPCSRLERPYTADNCNSGLEFSVHDNGSTSQPNPYFQNVSKGKTFKSTADGQWHKYTLHIVAGNGGYEEIWIDDVKVLDSRGKGYDHNAGAFSMFQLPGLVVGGCCSPNFSIDIDDLVVWR